MEIHLILYAVFIRFSNYSLVSLFCLSVLTHCAGVAPAAAGQLWRVCSPAPCAAGGGRRSVTWELSKLNCSKGVRVCSPARCTAFGIVHVEQAGLPSKLLVRVIKSAYYLVFTPLSQKQSFVVLPTFALTPINYVCLQPFQLR